MAVPKLRFKEFEGYLTESKLIELTSWASGGTPAKDIPEYWGDDIPLISGASMHTNQLYESDVKITKLGLQKGSKLAPKDSILILVRGSMLFNKIPMGITLVDVAFNQDVKCIRPKQELAPLFLFQWLHAKENTIQNKVTATGIGAGKLDTADLQNLKLYKPSSEEQTKIASFLSAVDEKINQLTQKHQLLSQYKQGMMQKLFSQQIRFKADDGSEFEEWECIQASNIFENYSNKNHDGSLTILAATQDKGVVPRDEIDIDIKSSDASVLSYKIIEKGNFVISLRSFQGGIEYSNYEGICSPAYTVLKAIKPIHTGFYKAYLKTNDFIQRLSSTVIGIRDGKQISYQAFSTLMIDYPCPEEQTKIANFLSAIDQKIEVTAQQIEQAKQWKKGLLQQMFV
nr:restriction endonuclease subunit S [Acinetobacter indicus]